MTAGLVTTIVGFSSSFAVVLTGLRGVGATPNQAASGLLTLCVLQGIGCIVFSLRYRMPITLAWSTPGAALLAAGTVPRAGFGTAVAAFLVAGLLIAACGLLRPLARAVAAIPPALANAMLAGVLLQLCVAPFRAIPAAPAAVLPVLAVWLLTLRWARRWAVPAALVAAVVVLVSDGSLSHVAGRLTPQVTLTAPHWDVPAVLAIAVPLFLVTMTGQNVPGMAVLASFGYRPPMKGLLVSTGLATAVGAAAGGHAVNLAAISAALAAGPSAHPDPRRRWVAGVTVGAAYLVVGPLAALFAAVAGAAPGGLLAAVAGLALISPFATAAGAALADGSHRDAGAITFLVSASGLTVAGVGSAFWGLLAGAVYLLVMRRR